MIIITRIVILSVLMYMLSACSGNKEIKAPSEISQKKQTTQAIIQRSGTKLGRGSPEKEKRQFIDAQNRLRTGGGLFGKKGMSLNFDDNKSVVGSFAMPINPYLWRGSLEAINFIPLSSADPFAGIIITEWYNDKKNVNERCKINIFIKGAELNTGNLRASIFCQENISGDWVDINVENEKNISLENAILDKAKKLHLSSQ